MVEGPATPGDRADGQRADGQRADRHPADRHPADPGASTRSALLAGSPAQPRVRLLGKPGCHLCDDARFVVEQVCAELGVGWEDASILDDPELANRYGEYIPVVFVDGVQHDFWRVSAERLRAALRTA